jgi:hypothetical protein
LQVASHRISIAAPISPSSIAAPISPNIQMFPHFRANMESRVVEVDEGDGNSFHLGPILRKYTSARLTVLPGRRVTSVEFSLLFDALGLLRSLQYDVQQFNLASRRTSDSVDMLPSELRYCCFRLNRQAAAFGVRLPRLAPSSAPVHVPGLDELVEFVESQFHSQIEASRTLISGGVVDFASLSEVFRPGVELLDRGLTTGIFGVPTAMRCRASYLSRGKSLFGVVSTFFAAMECLVAINGRFVVVECRLPISEFGGTCSLRDGLDHFVLLSDSMRQELLARGRQYASLGSTPCSFMQYTDGSFMPAPKGGLNGTRAASRARGSGRFMVDSQAALVRGVHCARAEGDAADAVRGVMKIIAQRARASAPGSSSSSSDAYTSGSGGQSASHTEDESLEMLLLSAPLPECLMLLSWPVVAGFSFHAKSFGLALVSGLRTVDFNENAFRRLVMPSARKQLIEALVLSHNNTGLHELKNGSRDSVAEAATDKAAAPHAGNIIAGKGEGAIFLLYGPPGVGKTLTAEAVAELLHKPLYVISMGELGTTPESLEERLLDVLDLCVPWGALVLIDEAEMLLERRSKNDIVRNAMVCVMLRLLEYYRGILFLTTNRVESIDPAFQSRVHCALKYDTLNAESRLAIWSDLLRHAAGFQDASKPGIDVHALAAHPLNGRQIKNVLQLALALCRHEGPAQMLEQRHLDVTLEITTQFMAETSRCE